MIFDSMKHDAGAGVLVVILMVVALAIACSTIDWLYERSQRKNRPESKE